MRPANCWTANSTPSTPIWGETRSRRRSCCGHSFLWRSTPSAASGSWWSRSTTIRHEGFRGSDARCQRHTPCGPKRHQPFIGHRWTHHPPRRLPDQPDDPETDRRVLRLAQDHRRVAQEPVCRARKAELPLCAGSRRLQPGSDAQSGDGGMLMARFRGGWCAWKRANRAKLANFRSQGWNRCASATIHHQEDRFSRVIFNGLLRNL